jgi:hypothetical protein
MMLPAAVPAAAARPAREMAVTFDDIPGVVAPGEGMESLRAITEKLVHAIVSRRIPAIGFVNEGKLAPGAQRDSECAAPFCTLDRALEDPAYFSADTFIGEGGISWLHRWALTAGGKKEILPGEPAPPRFVMEAAGVTEE